MINSQQIIKLGSFLHGNYIALFLLNQIVVVCDILLIDCKQVFFVWNCF